MNKRLVIIIAIFLLAIPSGLYFLYSQKPQTQNMDNSIQISPKTIVSEPTRAPFPTATTTVYVTLAINGFSPQVVTINPNTRVVWINKSGTQATINSDPHPTHTAYPPLNLGQFGKSERLSLIFPTSGRFGYHNHFDATQTGTVIVK